MYTYMDVYTYHWMFVNFHVVIIVKSCVKCHSIHKNITFVYIIATDYDGALQSRDFRSLSKHASKLVCLVLDCDK